MASLKKMIFLIVKYLLIRKLVSMASTLSRDFPKSRRVTFCEQPSIIYEPEELSEALRLSRQSDYATRQLDKMRNERLLTPVFCPRHRLAVAMRNQISVFCD